MPVAEKRLRREAPGFAECLRIGMSQVRSSELPTLKEGSELVRRRNLELDEDREKRLHELLRALPAAVYTTDASGRITFYNEAAATLWGCRPKLDSDQWCGSWRLYRPDGSPLPHDHCPMAIALKESRAINGQEAMAQRPDGTFVPFIAYPSPVRDASGTIVGAVNMLVDISERKRKEEQIELLAREVDHRSKNLLSLVLATVHLTQADSPDALKKAVEGRIRALANAHTLLAEARWLGAELHKLVAEELRPYCVQHVPRMRIIGPNLVLEPEMAQAIAVALHELTTNAVKYGALSVPTGHIQVEWSCAADGRVVILWSETGGPPVKPPVRRGFGMSVVDRMISDQLRGKVRFDWRRAGLVCEIAIAGASSPNQHSRQSARKALSAGSLVSHNQS
jgi:PAS domain S-box-containing protein